MGRLSKLRVVDPILSALALGYSNAELVGSALLPFVDVDKEGGKIPRFGKDAFTVYNTERALRAKSNRISPEDIDGVDVTLDEHDLEYPIDYREDAEAAFPLQAHATNRVVEGIRLRHEKMVADLVQNPNSYPTGNKIALSGTDVFTDPDSDPEGVIDDAMAAVRSKVVKEPNTAVIGYKAWRALKRHPKLKAILSDTRSRLVQLADLKEIFEIQNIVIGKGVWKTDAGVVTDLWGGTVVLAYVPTGAPSAAGDAPRRSAYEPSFGYTLRKKGQPVVDTRTEDGKLEIVRNTDIFRPFLLGAEAGYLVTGGRLTMAAAKKNTAKPVATGTAVATQATEADANTVSTADSDAASTAGEATAGTQASAADSSAPAGSGQAAAGPAAATAPAAVDAAGEREYVVGTVPIRHDGRVYRVGYSIHFTDAQAERLGGLVTLIPEAPKEA